MKWSSRFARSGILFCLLSFPTAWLYAHPHNWIQLETRFVLDESSRLIQVHQRWEFDPYYSLMTHADLLNEFGDEQKGLQLTAERMVRNLKGYDYFSTLRIDGKPIKLSVPDQYQLYTRMQLGQFILGLEMRFKPKTIINIENKTLAWQVFDPTYYISMDHSTENNIRIIGGNATECSKTLDIPEPSDELINYAQSLDQTQKDTDGLGADFAETVFIRCI